MNLLKLISWCLGLLCLLPLHVSGQVDTVHLWPEQSTLLAIPTIVVLPDKTGKLTWDQIRDQEVSWTLYQEGPELEESTVYWGRFVVKNESEDRAYWILSPDWQTGVRRNSFVDVYLPRSGQHLRAGRLLPFREKVGITRQYPNNQVGIQLEPWQTETIFIRVEHLEHRPPVFQVRMMTEGNWIEQRSDLRYILQATFHGIIWIMLLSALLNFFTRSRGDAYLYYALFLGAASFYFLSVSGILAETVLREIPRINMYVWVLASNSLALGYFQFARIFLNTRILMPHWDRWGLWFIRGVLVVMVLELGVVWLTYNFDFLERFNRLVLFGEITFLLVVSLQYAKVSRGLSRLFMWGTLCLVAGGYVGLLLDWFGLFQSNLTVVQLFVVIQTLTFSWGLGIRHRELKTDNLTKQEANERLSEMNQLKSRFFNDVSHELRTPLTMLIGNTEILQQDWPDLPEHQIHQQLGDIQRNGTILLRLTNQILDLGKLESGTYRPEWTYGEVMEFLNSLMASFESYALAKDIRYTYHSSLDELEMDYDPRGIQSIFSNLLSNAFKFTPRGGEISARIDRDDNQTPPRLLIRIQDNGAGISAEDREHIFDRYFQSRKNPAHSAGTGIGLALIKELLTRYQGHIHVDSVLGEGSTFTVVIPIQHFYQGLTGSAPPVVQDVLAEAWSPEPSIGKVSAPDFDHNLVLVVEDNPEVRAFVRRVLEKDYRVVEAANGEEGIQKAIEMVPDLIISDVMMPEKDGFELCETLKEDKRTNHVPIILLTALAGEKEKIKGLRYGADAYLVKPFKRDELLVRIEKLIEIRETLRQTYAGTPLETEQAPENPFLEQVRQIIEANLTVANFDVESLHNKLGLSYTQFYRKLKALTNLSAKLYIRNVRLDTAAQLLRSSELNISEVAYEVGFNDPAYFSRAFSERFDMPPSVYRG